MADYPSEFEFDVLLKNGEAIHVRPIRPSDADMEREFISRVGPESLLFRFHRPKKALTPEELHYFTNVDYSDRMALIAIHDEKMIAVGRYDLVNRTAPDGGQIAEVAFLVEDRHQGLGIGSHLLQHLTVYARLKGVTAFEAYVMADNHGMMRLFRGSGYRMSRTMDSNVFTVEFPIEYSLEAREAEWEHEKRSTTASLMPIFYPSSVAVIGASRNEKAIGGRLFRNLLIGGFAGPVYPVNPTAPFVNAVRAYPSVLDIPDPVDLALIAVPAQSVHDTLEQCGEKGVRGAVVISAGFGEVNPEGAEMERALVSAARWNGMRMVGPNCMGIVNTDPSVRLDAQFGPTFPPRGNVAMGSQSGALGLAILKQANDLGIGISTFVSLGNRADVSANDLMLYWEEDPATDVILLYMESFGSPRRFGRLARRIGRRKPVVVVKSGISSAGARAASSHTGSLASLDVAVDALFRQSGVIRTRTLDELFDVTALLSQQPLPRGRRVAVLTNAGGPAILTADALEVGQLELPQLSEDLQRRLGEELRSTASTGNPIDMVAAAGPEEYEACLGHLLATDEIDSIIVIHIPTTPEGSEAVVAAMERALSREEAGTKTILAVMMGGSESAPTTEDGTRIPTYPYPESAAQALTAAVRYAEWRDRPEGEFHRPSNIDRAAAENTIRNALGRLGEDGGWLNAEERIDLYDAYGVPSVVTRVAETEDEAVAAAAELGPVVVKVVSESAQHKSDVGGVVLNIEGEEAVRKAFREVTGVVDDATGVVVQQYIPEGHEVIVGMTEDPLFGPLLVFGLGGIYVELLKDVAFRINPISDADAREMIAEPRSSRLLAGYRGTPPGDTGAVEDLLLRISAMVDDNPEIAEMDMNPVKVLRPGEGVCAVDARVKVVPVKGTLLPSRKDVPGRML